MFWVRISVKFYCSEIDAWTAKERKMPAVKSIERQALRVNISRRRLIRFLGLSVFAVPVMPLLSSGIKERSHDTIMFNGWILNDSDLTLVQANFRRSK